MKSPEQSRISQSHEWFVNHAGDVTVGITQFAANLNYEMRNGRRYGFVNAVPCLPADTDGTSARSGS